MYCHFSKSQALPIAIRVSSQPRCFKSHQPFNFQSFSSGVYPKPLQNPNFISSSTRFASNQTNSITFHDAGMKKLNILNHGDISCGHSVRIVRSFSNSHSSGAASARGSGGLRSRRALPWLEEDGTKKRNESTNKASDVKVNSSSWEEAARKFSRKTAEVVGRSSREESGRKFIQRGGASYVQDVKKRSEKVGGGEEEEEVEEGEETEPVKDPRWDKIKVRLGGVMNAKPGPEKPESRRWSKEENWGRKTYREATESSIPKMTGEGVYGVGPVLAALSSGRREFYVLYVQEGIDLSSNNRKKKDKKGFEKVLRIADRIGLTVKEVSKHDLNMIVDNRPHQGLVLDASPLEMVNVKELDPVSSEEGEGLLWVALDEVTDPQNLGAIVRSAYFFGASGVVLCAKNSAPLSGVVSKASAGSLELMEVRSCKNMMQFLMLSANNGWRVIGGSVSSRAVPLHKIAPGAPTVLVLGSEGTGLRPLVERSCTQLVRIVGNIPVDIAAGRLDDQEDAEVDHKLSGEEFRSFLAVESLNVSVAAGVLLQHLIGSNCKDDSPLGGEATDDSHPE